MRVLTQVAMSLPRSLRQLIQVFADLAILSTAFTLAMAIEGGQFKVGAFWPVGTTFILCSVFGLRLIGAYNSIIRFSGIYLLELIILNQILCITLLAVCGNFLGFETELSTIVLLTLLSIFFLEVEVGATRINLFCIQLMREF